MAVKKSTKDILKYIHKEYSEDVGKQGSKTRGKIKRISTGSIKLDAIIGGGIPRGYITEVYGPEHSGKSTLIMEASREAQKEKLNVVYLDIEHRFHKKYAESLGVDLDNLIVIHPKNAEEALDLAANLIELGSAEMIILDSVAALLPAVEDEGAVGASHMGNRAKLLSQFLRKTTHNIYENEVAVVLVNRPTAVMGNYHGPSETTTGGRNLKHQATIRIKVAKGKITYKGTGEKQEPISHEVRYQVVKNSIGKAYLKTTTELILGKGIDILSEIINAAAYYGFVEQRGAYFYISEDEKYQGKEAFKQALLEIPELLEELKQKVTEEIRGN